MVYVNPNFGDPTIYWFLRLILFSSLFVTGYYVTYLMKDIKKYWFAVTPVMVLYTLIEGLRYLRGWDYPHYMYDLTKGLWSSYSEPIYIMWANAFRQLEIHFVYGFLFYSAILAFGFFLLLRDFHKAAFWACPLFLIIPDQSTNLIRMFFAMAFLLIGIHYLINKEKKAYVFFAISSMIHFSVIPVVFFAIFLNWARVGYLSNYVYVVLAVYLAFAFFWDVSSLDNIIPLLAMIDSSDFEQGNAYLSNAEIWFGTAGNISEKYGFKSAGLIMTTLNICVPAYIIYYGNKAFRIYPRLKVLLGCSVIAFFVQILGGGIELFSRYYHWMTCLIPILIGMIWYIVPMKSVERMLFIFLICFYYYIAKFIYYLFVPGAVMTGYGFIWDK